MKTLERADIENVFFGGHDAATTQVRGYQNYDISDDKIIAINNPSKKRPWTDTKIKSEFWKKIFNDLIPTKIIDRPKIGFPVPLDKIFELSDNSNLTPMDNWLLFNLNNLSNTISAA